MILEVFIVDDETPIREWVAYNIEQEKERFHLAGSAKSGIDALQFITEKKPHVVISDIVMPGMDGIELLRNIREVSPKTRVILLTNHADFQFAQRAVNYNAFDYLLKSELRSADLLSTLNRLKDTIEEETQNENDLRQGKHGSPDMAEIMKGGVFAAEELLRNGVQFSEALLYRVYALRASGKSLNQFLACIEAQMWHSITFSRDQIHFVCMQSLQYDDAAIPLEADRQEQLCFGISGGYHGSSALANAIEESECALLYGELCGSHKGILFEKSGTERINRKELWEAQQKISELLAAGRISESLALLEDWYRRLSGFSIEESIWVKEICDHMNIVISQCAPDLDTSAVLLKRNAIAWSIENYWSFTQTYLHEIAANMEPRMSPVVLEAVKYIDAHFCEDISLEEVAKIVYRSPEYLSRQFKQEVGENFSIYLITCRLNEARKLLRNEGLTVSETAERVGYPNASYFTRVYKKYMGSTPEREKDQNK